MKKGDSVSKEHQLFCPDHYKEIENYELALADNFKGWICHHKNGEEFSKEWLIKNNMYYDRKDPLEFRFLPTTAELSKKYGIPSHMAVHKKYTRGKPGHPHTDESRQHISKALSGKKKSKLHCKHMSESLKNSMCNVKSDFAIAYHKRFGISRRSNPKQWYEVGKFYFKNGCLPSDEWLKERFKD